MSIRKVSGSKKFDAIETAVNIDPEASQGTLVVVQYKADGEGNPQRKGRVQQMLPKEDIDVLMNDQAACDAKGAEVVGVTLVDVPAEPEPEAPQTKKKGKGKKS